MNRRLELSRTLSAGARLLFGAPGKASTVGFMDVNHIVLLEMNGVAIITKAFSCRNQSPPSCEAIDNIDEKGGYRMAQ